MAQIDPITASRAVLSEVANVLGAFRDHLVLVGGWVPAFVLRHDEPSLAALAERLRPRMATGLGREGYAILKAKFAAIDSIGPVWAARVLAQQAMEVDDEPGMGTSPFDLEQAQRASFEDAQELFRLVEQEIS